MQSNYEGLESQTSLNLICRRQRSPSCEARNKNRASEDLTGDRTQGTLNHGETEAQEAH